jgi:glutamate/tyrosine decarboxylase-like PLP-dependent enzyme
VPDGPDLDPTDWAEARTQAHRMLDGVLDHLATLRTRPVWQPMPEGVRQRFRGGLSASPTAIDEVYEEFCRFIRPYGPGNIHPGFMGWVQGGGTVAGVLAEMLAAGLNANVGGRDQAPLEVERQVLGWVREWFGFPDTASGVFVTGASMANFIGVLVARSAALGAEVRQGGLCGTGRRLTAYASAAVHTCVTRAMEMSGLGSDALRALAVDREGRVDTGALREAIVADRAAGLEPFLLVGTAGTVDVGAIDDLADLAAVARAEKLWFHVDGAIGALGVLAPSVAPGLAGIERADSIALDFHKWGQVPYDAGYILVRDGAAHLRTFASSAAYLRREHRGLSAGSPWPCDYGPDLSRGFRALKTWFTFKVHGTERIGAAIERTCRLARYLERRVEERPELELMAPVRLNIVCFRYRCGDADRLNARIVADLQESGLAAPSTTMLDGGLAIRAAIVNHRTRAEDIDRLVSAVLDLGAAATHRHARFGGAAR